jgi:DNA replication licensing factor MCM2
MNLRDHVRSDDIDLAIKIMLESFLQSQKYSISKNMRKKFGRYLTIQEDHNQLLITLLNRLVKDKVIFFIYYSDAIFKVFPKV